MLTKRLKKILVADDEEIIRSLCSEVLTVAGFTVDAAVNGAEALEMMKASEYDIVISDVNMPELNGMEFYRESVSEYPHMKGKFLFFTGSVGPKFEDFIAKTGACYLVKPFRISELIASVDEVVTRSVAEITEGDDDGKRSEGRFALVAGCEICEAERFGGMGSAAIAQNISRSGINIVHEGKPFLKGSSLMVKIKMNGLDVHRTAEVSWSKKSGHGSVSGLKFREPIPSYSIMSVIPAKRPEREKPEGGVGAAETNLSYEHKTH